MQNNERETRSIEATLETLTIGRHSMEITGWLLNNEHPLNVISTPNSSANVALQTRIPRPDIANLFPNTSNALHSGFSCQISFSEYLNPFIKLTAILPNGQELPLKLPFIMRKQLWGRFFKGFGHKHLYWAKILKGQRPYSAKQDLIENANMRQIFTRPIKADVILPVYNGIEHIQKLLPKLCSDTDISRLWIIDDASSDPAVIKELDQATAKFSNITLIRNTNNQGFVKSVNKALRKTKEDCILLNSDVDVPKDWITRLLEPIRSDRSVASTTPFSNCGTIMSFPVTCKDNHIFDDLDVDHIDKHFQKLRYQSEPTELPTGVGFCMGISQTALDEIGYFDENNFGKGYGEENDWCHRATTASFKHIAVPNMYVYHSHGGSFNEEERQSLLALNLGILKEKHPSYFKSVHSFIRTDPLKNYRDMASLMILAHECSDNVIVSLDHDLGGGATIFREEAERRHIASGKLAINISWQKDTNSFLIQAKHSLATTSINVSQLDDFIDIIEALPVTELQINSLVFFPNTPQTLEHLARYKFRNPEVATIFYLHDYHPLCAIHNLIGSDGSFCDLPNDDTCNTCLPNNIQNVSCQEITTQQWRKAWFNFFSVADTIRAFSEESADLFERTFPSFSDKLLIKAHDKPEINRSSTQSNYEKLVLGVVGNINHSKGSSAIAALAEHGTCPIVILGKFNGNRKAKSKLVIHGKYSRNELHQLINRYKINICFIPSIWPETYNLVADELMELEIPVVCFDIGAHASRIRQYAHGHVLPLELKDDAKALSTELERIYSATAKSNL